MPGAALAASGFPNALLWQSAGNPNGAPENHE
jgi:hypothetical protein